MKERVAAEMRECATAEMRERVAAEMRECATAEMREHADKLYMYTLKLLYTHEVVHVCVLWMWSTFNCA